MFTGIIQATAQIVAIEERAALRSFTLEFPSGFCDGLTLGASVAVDGVCLTVTHLPSTTQPTQACFDVMQHSLALTTLGHYALGQRVNVERAARQGAEIGGHPLSGHVDGTASLIEVRTLQDNKVWRVTVPPALMPYIFAKGYVALHGASLTVAEIDRAQGWLEVGLIPETRRATVFESLAPGAMLNIEIERSTQILVDTVRAAIQEGLKPFTPALGNRKNKKPKTKKSNKNK